MVPNNESTVLFNLADRNWPTISIWYKTLIIFVNLFCLFFAWFLLRIVWRPLTSEQMLKKEELKQKIMAIEQEYDSHMPLLDSSNKPKQCAVGNVVGDYSQPWTQTSDLWILLLSIGLFLISLLVTLLVYPKAMTDYLFWIGRLILLIFPFSIMILCGLIARYFCDLDEKGYIITNQSSVFKVNYTRKLCHLTLILVILYLPSMKSTVPTVIGNLWGWEVSCISFCILIKPLRERFRLFMIAFNAIDRPEDRPHTLLWTCFGNTLPTIFLSNIFQWIYKRNNVPDLSIVVVLINGFGDGLAEPIGILFGQHKYSVSAWCTHEARQYQRSLEGSACVWMASLIFISIFYQYFQTQWQYWIAMIVLPPVLTYLEAKCPHTIDNCALTIVGNLILLLIQRIRLIWIG